MADISLESIAQQIEQVLANIRDMRNELRLIRNMVAGLEDVAIKDAKDHLMDCLRTLESRS